MVLKQKLLSMKRSKKLCSVTSNKKSSVETVEQEVIKIMESANKGIKMVVTNMLHSSKI